MCVYLFRTLNYVWVFGGSYWQFVFAFLIISSNSSAINMYNLVMRTTILPYHNNNRNNKNLSGDIGKEKMEDQRREFLLRARNDLSIFMCGVGRVQER